jgi:hypothetical protein
MLKYLGTKNHSSATSSQIIQQERCVCMFGEGGGEVQEMWESVSPV